MQVTIKNFLVILIKILKDNFKNIKSDKKLFFRNLRNKTLESVINLNKELSNYFKKEKNLFYLY